MKTRDGFLGKKIIIVDRNWLIDWWITVLIRMLAWAWWKHWLTKSEFSVITLAWNVFTCFEYTRQRHCVTRNSTSVTRHALVTYRSIAAWYCQYGRTESEDSLMDGVRQIGSRTKEYGHSDVTSVIKVIAQLLHSNCTRSLFHLRDSALFPFTARGFKKRNKNRRAS